jgi:hypothetical protein
MWITWRLACVRFGTRNECHECFGDMRLWRDATSRLDLGARSSTISGLRDVTCCCNIFLLRCAVL